MNWYVLVNGEIKADNLNKISAFKYCLEYSDKHPEVEPNKILMCRKIRRNGKEMYCKASFEEFHEDGVMFNTKYSNNMILEGTILLGVSHGCQFRGRLIQYLKNDCALLENYDGERHIVYDYYAV